METNSEKDKWLKQATSQPIAGDPVQRIRGLLGGVRAMASTYEWLLLPGGVPNPASAADAAAGMSERKGIM